MTEEDRPLQLCGALADGFCILEAPMVDVGLRYGVNVRTPEKWRG
ncbi:hypothetical protein [Deinococcus hopiensis]|nr:hypothetical protein [Deinococcus hopiensis]